MTHPEAEVSILRLIRNKLPLDSTGLTIVTSVVDLLAFERSCYSNVSKTDYEDRLNKLFIPYYMRDSVVRLVKASEIPEIKLPFEIVFYHNEKIPRHRF